MPAGVPGFPPPPPPPPAPPPQLAHKVANMRAATSAPDNPRRRTRVAASARSKTSSVMGRGRRRIQRGGGERRAGNEIDGAVVVTVRVTVATSVPSSVTGLGEIEDPARWGAPLQVRVTAWL